MKRLFIFLFALINQAVFFIGNSRFIMEKLFERKEKSVTNNAQMYMRWFS